MMSTGTIERIAVDHPKVFAFRISGEVAAEDVTAMATTMNDAFDTHPSVSMLLIFDQYDGVDIGAGLDMETLTAQFRALARVDKYAVVGAPPFAATVIKMMDKVIPVDARTFERSEEQAAWNFVGATPFGIAAS
jgi:hypothetical protein